MTDAPKTIWRVAAYIPRHNDHGLASWPVKDHAGDGAVEYTLTTHSDALVAAAYEDGLSDGNAIAHGNEPACDPPAKAQAAYDAAIAQARREGWEAAQAENAKLREALRPFAEYMKEGEGRLDMDNKGRPLPGSQGVGWVYLTHGDFRAAEAALSGQDAEGET